MASTILEVSRDFGLSKQFLYRYLLKYHKADLIVSSANNKTYLISDDLKNSLFLELSDKINEVHHLDDDALQTTIKDDLAVHQTDEEVLQEHLEESDVHQSSVEVHQIFSSNELTLLEKIRELEAKVSDLTTDLRVSEYQRGIIEGKYTELKDNYDVTKKLIVLREEELEQFKPTLFGLYKKKKR